MDCNKKLDSDYLAMAELTKEIGSLVERSVNQGHQDLIPSDIEHILKMTSDVTYKMKLQIKELAV
jgi:hypothetical protein